MLLRSETISRACPKFLQVFIAERATRHRAQSPFVGARYGWNKLNYNYADEHDYADTAPGGEDSRATGSDPRPSA